LFGSLLVNCWLVTVMAKAEQPVRKRWLQLGLVLNIGFLCTFKYINFFLSNISFLLPKWFHFPDLALPLGISFFTLAQIMYLVDAYEELLPPMGLFDYATFVSFFPYVISGPIPKSKRILHQFPDFGGKEGDPLPLLCRGLFLFSMGLAKKVLLADAFAKIADVGFTGTPHFSALEAWGFAIAYAMQMYFDFSGYSDMAIGSALMLGIEIPRNFDAPLRAKTISEFWQRWHISLSQFITGYLYTPMLQAMRQRKLFPSTLITSTVAIFFAMCVAGLWHGPAWTFVVYGVIHGFALAVNQYWHKKTKYHLPDGLGWFLTFCVFLSALIFFRADSLHQAASMELAMVNPMHAFALPILRPVLKSLTSFSLAMLPIGLVLAFFGKSSDELSREFKPTLSNVLATGALVVTSCLFMAFNTSQSFLYFQF
jgi:D-alanyl-lipoteichoic acid acyltransferase DltB (MBOAT superfamily)